MASTHLVLANVGLHVTRDHLVEHRGRDVLQGLTQGSAHLILDLSLQEVVQAFTLLQRNFKIQMLEKKLDRCRKSVLGQAILISLYLQLYAPYETRP